VLDQGTYVESAAAFGLDATFSGRGVVCADFDNDGDVDLLELTNRLPDSGILWENQTATASRNYLRIRLRGKAPNTEAAGARIYVKIGEATQMREIMIGSNFTSQNPTVQIFGLDDATVVDEIVVEWPPVALRSGPLRQGTRLTGPIAASAPHSTLVIRQPERP
jgi:hypothetical protein